MGRCMRIRAQRSLVATSAFFFFALAAQGAVAGTQMAGSFTIAGSSGGTSTANFSCLGQPTCTGVYTHTVRDPGCSNTFTYSDTIILTGVDLSTTGSFQGTLSAGGFDSSWPGGSNLRDRPLVCTYFRNTNRPTFPYTGTWNGNSGTLTANGADTSGTVQVRGNFTANVTKTPPVFPLEVSGSITPIVSNIAAAFQFRPQDVGTAQSVFVFAMAPPSQVKGAVVAYVAPLGSPKDAPAQCVLAQLNDAGQLQGVTASTMRAAVTNTVSSQGAAVTVLNNVSTPQIAGATFYVGYGPNATAMINNGINRSAVSIPGLQNCVPSAPQSGWWWNPVEAGRGYSLEVQGNNIFFASYLYDASGRSTWYAALGPTSLEGSLFNGRLLAFAHGQTLTGEYRGSDPAVDSGAITLAFSDATHGTLTWPGGSLPIERFNIVANGLAAVAQSNQPESGWWWNQSEAGRGYFFEWQGTNAFAAGYMYDTGGNPLWYASFATTPNTQSFQGTWAQFADGQTLTGAYKPAAQVNGNAGSLGVQFQNSTNATMTLPNGRQIPLTRFRF